MTNASNTTRDTAHTFVRPRRLSLTLLACSVALSAQPGTPSFEAASIRVVTSHVPQTFSGGPGTADPVRVRYSRISLKYLINTAYGRIYDDRIKGPAWLDTEYEFTATMAPGTTKAQYHEMLKNFLVERFALAFHSQIGTVQGYELLLSPQGLNRAALNPAAAQANRDGSGRRPAKTDANGFLILDDGSKWQGIGDRDGNNKFTFSHCTMADLADMLSIEYSNKRTPVEDRTGIAGEFDFHLELPSHPLPFNFTDPHGGEAPASDPAPDLASVSRSIEKQLGVVLKPVKVNLSWMIVDHVDKVPRPN